MQVLTGAEFKKMLVAAAQNLDKEKERINALNVFPVPDGDTGTNMARTLLAAVGELNGSENAAISKIAASAAKGSLMGARGNSGVIMSQYFRGLSEGLRQLEQATATDLAAALESASKTTYRAVMKPVEGTMLTVGRHAAKAATTAAMESDDIVYVWQAALAGARKSLKDTPNILKVLKEAGVVDAGGEGLVVAFAGALAALNGQEVDHIIEPAPSLADVAEKAKEFDAIASASGELVYTYCTEFLIQSENGLSSDEIQGALDSLGDSLLVVGDSSVIKVHIHSNQPGKVLDHCGALGDLTEIKIDNMKLQNQALTGQVGQAKTPVPEKSIGIVAVVPGQGLGEIFQSLGVDVVVSGGQTMNPSTKELAEAIDAVAAESVIVLPNNKNVIFSAQQTREVVNKEVLVIPTRSIPQGISAMMHFDPDADVDTNGQTMESHMKDSKTGEVTFAVRSTKAGDIQIEEADIIGLSSGKIAVVGQSVPDVSFGLVQELVDEETSVVTIFSGEDVETPDAEALADRVRAGYPEVEVELHQGDQPLYYYIISVE